MHASHTNTLAGRSERWLDRHSHWLWTVLLLPILCSAVTRDLWAPDEPRYAQIAKEAFTRGEFIVLHLCDRVYPDKPPLFFWATGLLGWLSDWSVPIMRLISVGAVAGTAAIIAVWSRRTLGQRVASIAPALFLGNFMLFEIGGRLQLDPLLVFFCSAALYLLAHDKRNAACVALAGLATGLAVLTKGPVAFVNIGLPWLAWRWLDKRPLRVAFGQASTFFALAIGPALTWALLAVRLEPALAAELFFEQHVGRVLEGSAHHGPIWRPLLTLPSYFLPWSPFLLHGIVRGLRRDAERPVALEITKFIAWFALLFVFYSIIPTKRSLYLLPAFVPAAVIAAISLGDFLERPAARTWVAWPAVVSMGLLGAILAVGQASQVIVGVHPLVLGIAAVLLLGACWAARSLRRGQRSAWLRGVWGMWIVSTCTIALAVFPAFNAQKSAAALARVLRARPERPSVIPCVGVWPEGYRFYADLPTVWRAELSTELDREGEQFLALILDADWQRVESAQRQRCSILHTTRVGSKLIHIVGAAAAQQATRGD